jgi:molecular chaperone GrpE
MTPEHETRGPAIGPHGDPENSGPHAPSAAERPRKASDGSAIPESAPVDGAPTAGAGSTPPAEEERETAETDHERQLEHDLEELAAKAEKADEYLELAQRTRADFENYRKRATREAAAAQERGIAKLAKELLPAVDNLDRALEAAGAAAAKTAASTDGTPQSDNGTATLVSGIKLVHEDVIAALARAGIERFEPKGERFDPQLHEAIAQQPVEGAESGTVVEVYQRGYRLGEFVIRPARVVVAA